MAMKIYSEDIARMIDPTASTLASILEDEAGDYVNDYDIDEGARRYAQKLDYELEPLGILVTGDGKAYYDEQYDPDDEQVKSLMRRIDIDEILDSVDVTIKNSNGYAYHTYQWPAIVELMDDDIREEIHADQETYDTPQKFFDEYAKRHRVKFGEEWELDKADPVW